MFESARMQYTKKREYAKMAASKNHSRFAAGALMHQKAMQVVELMSKNSASVLIRSIKTAANENSEKKIPKVTARVPSSISCIQESLAKAFLFPNVVAIKQHHERTTRQATRSNANAFFSRCAKLFIKSFSFVLVSCLKR